MKDMVNPIRGKSSITTTLSKKKAIKELDRRVRKAALDAQKAAIIARQRELESRLAGIKAQKRAFLAQRAHMAQQLAAAKRVASAEKIKKTALQANKTAHTKYRMAKIRAYLARAEEKKKGKELKKYLALLAKQKKKKR